MTNTLEQIIADLEAGKTPTAEAQVVEKIASEHGREAKSPLINTEQGDLLLFAFLIVGAIAGFAAGYFWKTLLVNKARQGEHGGET